MDSVEVSLKGMSIFLGMPTTRDIPPQTALSLFESGRWAAERGVSLTLSLITGNAIITKARDEVLDEFLRSDCDRLLWVDSDIVWSPADLTRLTAYSAIEGLDVVCGAYPMRRDPPAFCIKTHGEINEYGLIDVEGIGLGFMLMTLRGGRDGR